MHDEDFAALLDRDRLAQALDVVTYVEDFRAAVPPRFAAMLEEEMEAVADTLPKGWKLVSQEGWCGFLPTHIPALAAAEVYATATFDEEDDGEPDVRFIGPWYGIYIDDAKAAERRSLRARLRAAVEDLMPEARESPQCAAWLRPEGFPKASELDEIMSVTGEAGRDLAKVLAAKARDVALALEAAR